MKLLNELKMNLFDLKFDLYKGLVENKNKKTSKKNKKIFQKNHF